MLKAFELKLALRQTSPQYNLGLNNGILLKSYLAHGSYALLTLSRIGLTRYKTRFSGNKRRFGGYKGAGHITSLTIVATIY